MSSWYYREAFRVTPYLVRDWWRGLRLREFGRIAQVIGVSYACTITVGLFFLLTVWSIAALAGASWESFMRWWLHPSPPILLLLGLLPLQAVGTTLAGFIAASIDRRTPIVSAISFGIVWSTVILLEPLVLDAFAAVDRFPTWYRFAIVAVILAGTSFGAMLRVATAHSARTRAAVAQQVSAE